MRSTNSYGNDNRGVRRFLRESGIAPTAGNVERMAKELRRSQSENERMVRESKARGGPALVDRQGRDAKEVARREVQRELAARPVPKGRPR